MISRLSPTLQGAFWLVAGSVSFAVMTVLIRPAAETLHAFEIVFLRNVLGLALMVPWLMHGVEIRIWRSPHFRMHLVRASLLVVSMICWYTAIPRVALADAVALSFSAPLFVTVLATLVLHEPVGPRRWAAVAVGFTGMLVVVRPGFHQVSVGVLLVVLDAFLWAIAIIMVRVLSRAESARTIVTYMFILVMPISAVPAAFVWTWPDAAAWGWVLGLALSSTLGHYCATRAFVVAEASAIMPFDYLRIVWFTAAGYLVFGETPDRWSLVGAAIIATSSLYVLRREALLAREGAGPAAVHAGAGEPRSRAPRRPPARRNN